MLVVECTFLSSSPLLSLFPSSHLSPSPLPSSTIPLSEEFDEALHGGGGEYLTEEAFDAEDSFDVSDVLPSLPPHLSDALPSLPPHLSDALPSSPPHLLTTSPLHLSDVLPSSPPHLPTRTGNCSVCSTACSNHCVVCVHASMICGFVHAYVYVCVCVCVCVQHVCTKCTNVDLCAQLESLLRRDRCCQCSRQNFEVGGAKGRSPITSLESSPYPPQASLLCNRLLCTCMCITV